MKPFLSVILCFILTSFCLDTSAADDNRFPKIAIKAGWFLFQDDLLSESIASNWSIGADLKVRLIGDWYFGPEISFLTKKAEGRTADDIIFCIDYMRVPVHFNVYYTSAGMQRAAYAGPVYYLGGGITYVYNRFEGTTEKEIEIELIDSNGTKTTSTKIGPPEPVDFSESNYGMNIVIGAQFDAFFLEGQYIFVRPNDATLGHIHGSADVQNADGKPSGKIEEEPAPLNVGGLRIWAGIRF